MWDSLPLQVEKRSWVVLCLVVYYQRPGVAHIIMKNENKHEGSEQSWACAKSFSLHNAAVLLQCLNGPRPLSVVCVVLLEAGDGK